ncbi:hypothetical protein C4564_05550 [Candidatus Microgenomates bacterium]|nr:MAG: hypothetical protein C4564_05550 [Candidatus Microgenomates bacterium]
MQKLLIATTNPGKLSEYKEFLDDLPFELVSLSDIGITQKAPENAKTFADNAKIKALFYHELSHLPTIADDGGFEIAYLSGAPGVRSHRWIHKDRDATDDEIIAYVLEEMHDVPDAKRGAQLRLFLSFAHQGDIIMTVEDQVGGIVAHKAHAHYHPGYVYRSLLFFPEINKYYDELTQAEMETYNHRKRAVKKLIPIIKNQLQLS